MGVLSSIAVCMQWLSIVFFLSYISVHDNSACLYCPIIVEGVWDFRPSEETLLLHSCQLSWSCVCSGADCWQGSLHCTRKPGDDKICLHWQTDEVDHPTLPLSSYFHVHLSSLALSYYFPLLYLPCVCSCFLAVSIHFSSPCFTFMCMPLLSPFMCSVPLSLFLPTYPFHVLSPNPPPPPPPTHTHTHTARRDLMLHGWKTWKYQQRCVCVCVLYQEVVTLN